MLKYLIILILISIFVTGRNWHTSQVSLLKLYDLQEEHFDVVNEYLELEKTRLEELKKLIIVCNDWHMNNGVVEKNYLYSPINGLKLMSRLHNNLNEIENRLKNENSLEVLKKINETHAISDFNIVLAFEAIRRLQRVYAISATDMAAGRYHNRNIGDPLDSCSCYVMCEHCFEQNDMFGVIDWAIQIYNKWVNEGQPKCVNLEKLQYYIIVSSVYTGFNFKTLLPFREQQLSTDTSSFSQYFSLMENDLIMVNMSSPQLDIFDTYDSFISGYNDGEFQNLCRKGSTTRTVINDLRCRYQTKNSMYRLLMPFKEEDVSSDPYVKIYHDVLYDNEIKKIKDLTEKNMIDAEIRTYGGDEKITEKTRSGQVNWIEKTNEGGFFDSLNSRIESFTEYSLMESEKYQTVNYGLGGHFSGHFDPFGIKLPHMNTGNRIVTVLFYMNDVENDGYTPFPKINFVSSCIKGSAVVWLNLHLNNGTIHQETLHGSCPILKGNKWITTKWLYEGGQSLTYNWEKTTHYNN